MDDRSTTKLVRPLCGGQITIPAEFRKQLGITDTTMLRLTLAEGELRIVPVQIVVASGGSSWLRDLYELYAPVREEIRQRSIPQEEVNADIDAAISAVRAERHAEPE